MLPFRSELRQRSGGDFKQAAAAAAKPVDEEDEEEARLEVTDDEVATLKKELAHLARSVDLGKFPKELLALEQQAQARADLAAKNPKAKSERPPSATPKLKKPKEEKAKKMTAAQIKAASTESGKGFTVKRARRWNVVLRFVGEGTVEACAAAKRDS